MNLALELKSELIEKAQREHRSLTNQIKVISARTCAEGKELAGK
jgi:hypothetical protein